MAMQVLPEMMARMMRTTKPVAGSLLLLSLALDDDGHAGLTWDDGEDDEDNKAGGWGGEGELQDVGEGDDGQAKDNQHQQHQPQVAVVCVGLHLPHTATAQPRSHEGRGQEPVSLIPITCKYNHVE